MHKASHPRDDVVIKMEHKSDGYTKTKPNRLTKAYSIELLLFLFALSSYLVNVFQ